MTNYEKIKSMSVENMAEMLLDASENHLHTATIVHIKVFMHRIVHLTILE